LTKTILILAANPKDTPPLRLDEEVREIDNGLERAQKRDEFTLKQKLAARPDDVRRAMLKYEPNIVHFCGHGSGVDGIAFEDEGGEAKLVSTDALTGFFELFADKLECVVLNACYSEVQAEAIAKHIPYVIGMKKAIGDAAAIKFAVAFYDALGAGRTVQFAYKLACNALQWWLDIPEHLTPILKSKPPEKQFLASTLRTGAAFIDFLDVGHGVNPIVMPTLIQGLIPAWKGKEKTKTITLHSAVFISGGRYQLGTDVERFGHLAEMHSLPVAQRRPILMRQVGFYNVPSFQMSAICVTNEEYFKFTKAHGKKWPAHWDVKCLDRFQRPFPPRFASQPIVNVTAEDAQAYCIWSRTRLPSWSEWERAASGQARQPYPWGVEYSAARCNSVESGCGSLAAVDDYSLGDSPEGARQLCGNVAEWVVGPEGQFELRGGSYRLPCELWGLAYAFRQPELGYHAPDVGFRDVRDLIQDPSR